MNEHVPGSTLIKWVIEDDGKTLRGDVPNMGVTFTVTPVSRPDERIDREAKVFVRAIEVWPPIEKGHWMAGYYARCTLIDAKKNAIKSFMTWAGSVEIISTTDGRGHITLDIGQEYGIRNKVTE